MSWPAKGLLFVSIALIFFSCRDNGDVGLNLPNGKPLKTSYTDTFLIYHTTVIDTVKTLGKTTNKLLAGSYIDPVFGKVTAEAYVQLGLALQLQNPAGYRSVDSVILTLNFWDNGSSPDSQAVANSTVGIPQYYAIHVYELKSQLDTNLNRFNVSLDNLTVGTTKLDALNNAYPYNIDPSNSGSLRIYLNNSYGKNILDYAAARGGIYTYDFVSNVTKGLAILPDPHLPSAIVPFSLASGSSLNIYYTDSDGNIGADFVMYLNADTAFSTISADRSATILKGLPNITPTQMQQSLYPPPNQNMYLEGGVGIREKIYIPGLKSFTQTNNNKLLINNAVLYLPVIDSVSAPDFIYLYDSLGHALSTAHIDYNNMNYSINVTGYLQQLIFQQRAYGPLYIQPSWRLNNSSVKRVVIGSGVQLQVYYTQQ